MKIKAIYAQIHAIAQLNRQRMQDAARELFVNRDLNNFYKLMIDVARFDIDGNIIRLGKEAEEAMGHDSQRADERNHLASFLPQYFDATSRLISHGKKLAELVCTVSDDENRRIKIATASDSNAMLRFFLNRVNLYKTEMERYFANLEPLEHDTRIFSSPLPLQISPPDISHKLHPRFIYDSIEPKGRIAIERSAPESLVDPKAIPGGIFSFKAEAAPLDRARTRVATKAGSGTDASTTSAVKPRGRVSLPSVRLARDPRTGRLVETSFLPVASMETTDPDIITATRQQSFVDLPQAEAGRMEPKRIVRGFDVQPSSTGATQSATATAAPLITPATQVTELPTSTKSSTQPLLTAEERILAMEEPATSPTSPKPGKNNKTTNCCAIL